ncbi:hypothetical protein Trydic_g23090 [Trypoxylus dichotomus]
MQLLIVLLLVTAVCGGEDEDYFLKDAVQFLDECGSKTFSICFKERVLTYIDQLPADIEVGSMFTVRQIESSKAGRRFSSITLPDEPRAREEMLDNILAERIYDYFTSHIFEFKIPTNSMKEWKRSFDNEARKKGNRKGMSLLLLLQLKAAMIGAIVLKLIGLVAFKALVVAKIALTIASVIGLRKLLESKHRSSTYEVVAHPHYTEEHIHDRSLGQHEGQELV